MGQADALKEEDNRGCCSIHDNDVTLEMNIGLVAGEAAMNNINPYMQTVTFIYNIYVYVYVYVCVSLSVYLIYINISFNLFIETTQVLDILPRETQEPVYATKSIAADTLGT